MKWLILFFLLFLAACASQDVSEEQQPIGGCGVSNTQEQGFGDCYVINNSGYCYLQEAL